MRIPRVYIETPLVAGQDVTLNTQTSHYLCNVLRLSEGRPLIAFCNDGAEYSAELQHAHKKSAVIHVQEKHDITRESPLAAHLAIGLSRGERFEWVLQKATELGITQITPLITERTEVKLQGERLAKKTGHWQSLLASACEQCQRNRLPQLNPLTPLSSFIQNDTSSLKFVLHHRSERPLSQGLTPKSVTLLIGPEGGLSEGEIAHALDAQYQPLTLGPRVLRTETAPIAAISLVQWLWGDLGVALK